MRRASCFPLAALVAVCFCGCGNEKSSASAVKKPLEEELTGEYKTATEREYARIAYQFAKSLQSGDSSTAYRLCSSHLQLRMKEAELDRSEAASKREFGIPVRIYTDPVVNTEPEDLAGPRSAAGGKDGIKSNLQNMKAMRAVGEIPASVPVEIRRASVRVEIERDPQTVPDFQERTGLKPDELTPEDRVVSYLTAVVVEENRVLGVAYYYHRWPDIWDEELTPGTRSAEETRMNRADSAGSAWR